MTKVGYINLFLFLKIALPERICPEDAYGGIKVHMDMSNDLDFLICDLRNKMVSIACAARARPAIKPASPSGAQKHGTYHVDYVLSRY